MKILQIGDLHASLKRPKNRLDIDYFGTILDKFIQIVVLISSDIKFTQ